MRIDTVSENSKSLMSPSTTIFAFRSASSSSSTNEFTIAACWCRCTSLLRIGGWKRPNSGSSPPLEFRWLPIAKSVRPLPAELARERLAAVRERRVRRIDPPGAVEELGAAGCVDDLVRCHCRPARPVDERQSAVGAEEEALPDVAARLAAVLVEQRVDLAVLVRRAALRLDRRDQHLPGQAGIGRRVRWPGRCCPAPPRSRRGRASAGCATIRPRQGGELLRRVGRVEVLDVEGRDGELVAALRLRDFPGQAAVDGREVVDDEELEVPEGVVDDRAHGVVKRSRTSTTGVGRITSSRMIRSGLKSFVAGRRSRRGSCGCRRSSAVIARTEISPKSFRGPVATASLTCTSMPSRLS